MSGIPAGAGSLVGKRLGKYEILALLALGGTAEIYLARIGGHAGFEKYVVVKCLHDHLADDQDFVKMFLDEARMSAMLDHSNVVQTLELGEYDNRYYMVMEFLAGLSLAMVVRRAAERIPGGMIPVPLVLNLAAQACAGLHYAHERTSNGKPLHMVHRDISPQNLVISFEGVVKVVDFGIARAEYRETKTKAGTIKGKFAYMSPEQCVANNVDRRTDVFALGVIVHELLTGKRLFKRNSPYETYQAVLECAVEPPSKVNNQLDPALDPIIMKAVAKDKDHRYPTAEAFGDAMLGYLHHRGKGSGGNELGRFFEQHFDQEIEEHGERMRELISGREVRKDTGVGWGDEDDKANRTVDLSGNQDDDVGLETGEIIEMRSSEASLDQLVDEVDGGGGDDDDENPPADRTRIEMNPLDTVQALDQQVARNSGNIAAPTQAPNRSGTAGPAPLPAPPTGPVKAVVGARQSGKFPDLPNLPTVVAADAEEVDTDGVDIDGETILAPQGTTPERGRLTHPAAYKRTEFDMVAQTGPAADPSGQVNQKAAARTQPETAMPEPPAGSVSPPFAGYPVMPGGQRPFSSDLAPSNMSSTPQRSPYAGAPLDPMQAANVMSPVGDAFPATDWERAAEQNAKALPPWQLAALFAAALGGALLLTFVLAKIFS
jgi:hypothetical protein